MIDEQARRDFEQAWRDGRPDLHAFLPPEDDPRRDETFVELICIDLELSWKTGAAQPRVESYGRPVDAELAREEWRVRHKYGDRPAAAEFVARFPQLFADDDALGPAPAPVLRAGAQVGRYRLEAEHARGGFGLVWRARDETLGREIALKQLAVGDDELRRRFVSEAKITARLEHPGVVPVYDLVEHDDGAPALYAMKLVRGVTLEAAIRAYHEGGRAPVERLRLLNTFLAVVRTMAFAHARGVVHRDLKPDNVLLGEYGETVILDWGLAKSIGAADEPLPEIASAAADATRAGTVLGTPAFMAPEQVRGDDVDARSDVYGLGCVLYLLLTGRAPHPGRSSEEVLARRAKEQPAPPRRVAAGVPRPLDAICRTAMAVAPADRYADAGALAADVERYLADEAVSCYRETLPERARRWARRHRTLVTVGGIALVLLTAGALASAKLLSDEQGRTAAALADARELLYVNGMALADRAWREYNVDRARDLLDDCPEGLRGWEWHYARRRCDAFLESADLGVPFPMRVAMHPDGRRGAVVYRPRDAPAQCATFDLDAGGPATPLPDAADTAAAAYSPDGRWLATCGEKVVALRDASGAVVKRLAHDQPTFYDLAFHPDGTKLAAIGQSTTLVWSIPDGAPVFDVRSTESGRAPMDDRVRVAWSSDGTRLVTAGGDPKVWSAADGRLLRELPRTIVLLDLAASREDVALAGYDRVERAGVLNLLGQGRPKTQRSTYHVLAAAFAGERTLVTANSDRVLRVWSVQPKLRIQFELAGHGGDVFDLAVRGERAFSVDGRSSLKVWDVTRDPNVRVVRLASGTSPIALGRAPGGATLHSGLYELAAYDAATGAQGRVFDWSGGHLYGAVAGGRLVAAWGSMDVRDFTLALLDADSGALRHVLATKSSQIGGVAFSPGDRRVAAAAADGHVRVWDCPTGKRLAERKLSDAVPFDVAFLSDGRLLAVDMTGRLLVADGDDVQAIDAHRGRALRVVVAPDGATFATGGDDYLVHLWDAATLTRRATFRGHDQPVTDLAFATDAPRLASLDTGSEIRVWWLGPDREVFALRPPDRLSRLAWTPGALAAVGREGLYFWDARR